MMRVAFLSVGESPRYAKAMIRSVKRHIDAEVLHLTDDETPPIDGTTTVRMSNTDTDLTVFRMRHLSMLDGDILCLDSDVLVMRDPSAVFGLQFDVGLTYRDGPVLDPNGVDITKHMPINTGVLFCRNPEFWEACLRKLPDKPLGFYIDQFIVAAVAKSGRFDVLKLHCDNFNHKPLPGQDLSTKHIVHFKGGARPQLDQLIEEGMA